MAKCNMKCEVYSRVVGYMRPVKSWNIGKKEEFKHRKVYNVKDVHTTGELTKIKSKVA